MIDNFINDPYLVVFDGVFERAFCQTLISKYDNVLNSESDKIRQLSICQDKEGNNTCKTCTCTRIDLMQHETFAEDASYVANVINDIAGHYQKVAKCASGQFPKKWKFENLKIKKYRSGTDDGMLPHIDVFDQSSSIRFLAFIVYLNDDFEGGETNFLRHDIKIKPRTGSVVCFPPYWPWWHSAEKITSGSDKYFMGTYLHHIF